MQITKLNAKDAGYDLFEACLQNCEDEQFMKELTNSCEGCDRTRITVMEPITNPMLIRVYPK